MTMATSTLSNSGATAMVVTSLTVAHYLSRWVGDPSKSLPPSASLNLDNLDGYELLVPGTNSCVSRALFAQSDYSLFLCLNRFAISLTSWFCIRQFVK